MVGAEDLIASILESGGGGLQFDKCIATPELMPKLSKVSIAQATGLVGPARWLRGQQCSACGCSRSIAGPAV